ncbi:MAG: hypothetical protein A3G15_03075 [Candidatus Levybacteria bacterium RIFCSPLOWO2_12_FULL_40_10]|nr:MAG: hypothetical protein A3G15_03075 [Candidatus Levybacteria bacterium RIFCSPLOWO2_12_FULL_40_10]
MKLSVVILTKNEENNILDCVESVSGLSEIIIVDDYSEDRTLELIKNLNKRNVKIFRNHLNSDFSKQRNFGLSLAKNEWVLFLDADERLSEDLASEISNFEFPPRLRSGRAIPNDIKGFYIKRRDIIWGRKLNYGETGDIKLLRLARKGEGKWVGRVHETWEIKGRVGQLEHELLHYPHQTILEFLEEINYYSTIRAEELAQDGERVWALSIILYPKAKFVLNYFLKLGFLDGLAGLVVALMMSFHSFLVRGKLWLIQNRS